MGPHLPRCVVSSKHITYGNYYCLMWAACRQDPLLAPAMDSGSSASERIWRASSMYGIALLRELCREGQASALRAWAVAAPAVRDAAQQALAAAGGGGEGMRRLMRLLASLRSLAQMYHAK